MSDKVKQVPYYHLEVKDEAGAAFTVLSLLKEHGVNLANLTAFPSRRNHAKLTLVPTDPDTLERAAKVAQLRLSGKKTAFLIQGNDRPGAVAEALKALGDAKINVTACNATVGDTGNFGMLVWVKAKDFTAAARALGVLTQ